jgi:uncharacterized membrane protein YidH (DUF202 family)
MKYASMFLSTHTSRSALVQLFRLSPSARHPAMHTFAEPLGAILIITGLLTLVIGVPYVGCFTVQNALLDGKYPASHLMVVLPALVLGLVIAVVFALLVVVRILE